MAAMSDDATEQPADGQHRDLVVAGATCEDVGALTGLELGGGRRHASHPVDHAGDVGGRQDRPCRRVAAGA